MEKDFRLNLVLKAEEKDGSKYVYGVASDTMPDLQGDIVSKEALEKMAKTAIGLPFIDEHDTRTWKGKLGTIIESNVVDYETENPKLFIKARLKNSNIANDFYNFVQDPKEKMAMSIGGKLKQASVTSKDGKKYRCINDLAFQEVSATMQPANPGTFLEAIAKSVSQEESNLMKDKIDVSNNWLSEILKTIVVEKEEINKNIIVQNPNNNIGIKTTMPNQSEEALKSFGQALKKTGFVKNEPAETKTIETKPVENKPIENKQVETKPIENELTVASDQKESVEESLVDTKNDEVKEEKNEVKEEPQEIEKDNVLVTEVSKVFSKAIEEVMKSDLTANQKKEAIKFLGDKMGEEVSKKVDEQETITVPRSFIENVYKALQEAEEIEKKFMAKEKPVKEDMEEEEMPKKKVKKSDIFVNDEVSKFIEELYPRLQASKKQEVVEKQESISKSINEESLQNIVKKTIEAETAKIREENEVLKKKIEEIGNQEVERRPMMGAILKSENFKKLFSAELEESNNKVEKKENIEERGFKHLAKQLADRKATV